MTPSNELALRRKLTFRSNDASIVLVKRPIESVEHVLQKAFLWALYLPMYPGVRVEVPFGNNGRYKPDLLALDGERPLFWGECGVVSVAKLNNLLGRHRQTHFVFSKWQTTASFDGSIDRALTGLRRSAPVELICFPAHSTAWIDRNGRITIPRAEIDIRRWETT
jgi:hypothetical protein